ncbi:MAG: hypothetical protein GYB67_07930 [Chloroflexi bacterium]|nr:hypothetical protein [Chloroflexota bacterium]
MSAEHSIETTGENVEDAIAKGLAELGVGPTEVIVEVLEEPSRGVLGFGARPAKVRLQLLSRPQPPPPPQAAPESVERPARPQRPARPARAPEPPPYLEIDDEDEDGDHEIAVFTEAEAVPEAEQDDEAAVGKVVLTELLERMGIRNVEVVVRRARASSNNESAPWVLDVVGGNSQQLIGRRGETLAALQYISRLIASRELQRRAELIIDVDGYKGRRAQSLYALAMRMADEAIERDRTVALEPMPPHERRIVHMALRERTDVITRSVGDGTSRKVTIIPRSS